MDGATGYRMKANEPMVPMYSHMFPSCGHGHNQRERRGCGLCKDLDRQEGITCTRGCSHDRRDVIPG